jgi:ABC-type branched-subunit amino acid transport system substrate-binding protein
MNSPIRDEQLSDHSKYIPRNHREQNHSKTGGGQPYPSSAPTAPASRNIYPGNRPQYQAQRSEEYTQEAEFVAPPPLPFDDRSISLVGRIATVIGIAGLIALLIIFAKPLSQTVRRFLNDDTQTSEAPARREAMLSTTAAPRGPDSEQQASRSAATSLPSRSAASGAVVAAATEAVPLTQQPQATVAQLPPRAAVTAALPDAQAELKAVPVRGVTDAEIRFGIAAPFSGPAKELGQNMKLGIETAFHAVNATGGVAGRQLKLLVADDGYDPTRTPAAMKELYDKEEVFGLVGNVGTPTAVVSLPYALDRKMLFFGAFTGAGLLRSDPPDRYVFNYRASYAEETEAIVHYLVRVRHIKPNQIAVFAQSDAYGDAGFAGVMKAMRQLRADDSKVLRLGYQRNTVAVEDAISQLQKSRIPIKAVIMVPTYRAAARFIEKTRDLYPDMIYASVSFVGSTALANELMLLGKRYATGVIVSQVVPVVDGHSTLVLNYKSALGKYFPGETPDYVSLEGYVMANVLIAALQRTGRQLDTEKLVDTFENLRNLDIGLGTPVSYGRSEHQAVHKVWGSELDENGHYQPIDLQ